MPTRLNCPTCQRQIVWSDEYPYRPFCSERCRLIDLGAWLSEQRAIADKEPEFSNDTPDDDQTRQN
ncbi:MAG: DNA gyrase inhibitor YacG [Steroidobacteraceae bacterium]